MAVVKKCVSIDEGLDFWLRDELTKPNDFKNFSDIMGEMIKRGIRDYEREKKQQISEQARRDETGEAGSPLHGVPVPTA